MCVCVCVLQARVCVLQYTSLSIARYGQRHKDSVLAARAAARLRTMHTVHAEEEKAAAAGPARAFGIGALRQKAAHWFSPLWAMVDPSSKWPIALHHLESIRRNAVAKKSDILETLKATGQGGRHRRCTDSFYRPAHALQGYIIGCLDRRVEPTTPCASYDEGVRLHGQHGGKGLLEKTCWQQHPGLCATLDAPVLDGSLAFARSLVSYVRKIGAASQRYLLFVRQAGETRQHLLVFMAGSTLIASGPRVILFAQKIAELSVPRVRKTVLRCKPCKAEDWMHVYEQPMSSHFMASKGFVVESTVRCEHVSRKSPRLGLQEPAWLTECGLGKCLQMEAPPAAYWTCFEATVVNKSGRSKVATVLSGWTHVDLQAGVRGAAAAGQASKATRESFHSLDGALKNLPDDALLTEDMLLTFSGLRRGAKVSNTTTPPAKPKQRAPKRIADGQKSENSDSSDGVTSESDDGALEEAAKSVRKKRKAVKPQQHDGDDNQHGKKKQKADSGDGAAGGVAGAAGAGDSGGASKGSGASSPGSGGASGTGGASGSGVAAAGAGEFSKKTKRTVAFGYSAPPGSRAVEIDGRVFAELWPEGVHTGYSLACMWHAGCSRSCGFGKKANLSPSECRRRLLNWEWAGSDLQGTAVEMFDEHRQLGSSKLLSAFASDD